MKLFYNLLFFLGLRKKDPVITNNYTFSNIFLRKLITQKETKNNAKSLPRKITKLVYQKEYQRDLSPTNNIISIIDNIPKITININMEQNELWESFFSWCYSLFILIILSVQPIYLLYFLFVNPDHNFNFYIAIFFFELIIPIQYILALIYFSQDHFERSYVQNPNYCFPSLNRLTLLNILFTSITTILNYFIINQRINFLDQNDGEFPLFNSFSLTKRIFISIFLFVSWIYGELIVINNLICFTLVFCKHCKIIKNYVRKLEEENKGIVTLNDITQDTLFIKTRLEESIDKFIGIFSSFTLFGAISFGFFIERFRNNNFNFFPWASFIIYLIVQIIFLVVVFRVSNNKDNLSKFIKQPYFIKRFLKRYTTKEIKEKFEECDTKLIILNIEEENASTIDWIILNNIMDKEWANFCVLGISLSDFELIKRGLVIVALIVSVNSLFVT